MSREIHIPNADIYEKDAPGYIDFLTQLIDSREDANTFITVVNTSGLLKGMNDGMAFLLNEIHIENAPLYSNFEFRNVLGIYLPGEPSRFQIAALDPYFIRDRKEGINESRNLEFAVAAGCNFYKGNSAIQAQYMRADGSNEFFDFPIDYFMDAREVGK